MPLTGLGPDLPQHLPKAFYYTEREEKQAVFLFLVTAGWDPCQPPLKYYTRREE